MTPASKVEVRLAEDQRAALGQLVHSGTHTAHATRGAPSRAGDPARWGVAVRRKKGRPGQRDGPWFLAAGPGKPCRAALIGRWVRSGFGRSPAEAEPQFSRRRSQRHQTGDRSGKQGFEVLSIWTGLDLPSTMNRGTPHRANSPTSRRKRTAGDPLVALPTRCPHEDRNLDLPLL